MRKTLTIARRILVFIFAALAAVTMYAQNIDMASIDVSKMPEEQIKTYAQKLRKQGFTLDMVLDQAKARGASNSQLAQIKRRMNRYFSGTLTMSSTEKQRMMQVETGNEISLEDEAELKTSQKQTFKATRLDSLIYGFEIFNREGLTFEPSQSLTVGDSYTVGVGDNIAIDIYGSADQSYELTVTGDGFIQIPMVGPVKVAGRTLGAARAAIIGKMKSIYNDLSTGRTKAFIHVTSTSPVKVSVMGEAFMPGSYTVSSAASLFHVLYLCGGPNSRGSYRDIQLIRGGKIVARLDVYDFLVNGKGDTNVSLADGDIVMVPPYLKRVGVGGEFRRTGYFEAKEGETVADIIRYAGGFTAKAKQNHIGVYRYGRNTQEYKGVANPVDVMLANGDSVVVAGISMNRLDNFVSVDGAVFGPGFYEFKSGMMLKNLIEMAGGLTENAFRTRAVISRLKEDYTLEALNVDLTDIESGKGDVELKTGDFVMIASIDEMRQEQTVSISGQVNAPGSFAYRENLTLGDLIVLAHGLTENASTVNVEIVRRLSYDEAATSTEKGKNLETVTISRDLRIDDAGNSFALEPFDQVLVRSVPSANIGGTVTLSGAFITPGDFGLTSNTVRLRDIVERSGGLNGLADVNGARLFRLVDMSDKEKEIRIRRQMATDDVDRDTLYFLRSGQAYELIALDLAEAIANPSSSANIYLRNGDELQVPTMGQTVRVSGCVQNSTSLVWNDRWNARDYVKAAGGFGSRAKKRKTYVVHANGQSEQVKQILFVRIYPKVRPGSEVVVPEKPEKNIGTPAVISMTSSLVSMAAVIVSLLK